MWDLVYGTITNVNFGSEDFPIPGKQFSLYVAIGKTMYYQHNAATLEQLEKSPELYQLMLDKMVCSLESRIYESSKNIS